MDDLMSHAQFANQVNHSGATRELGSQRRAPASGYYVSRPASEGHERKIAQPVSPANIAAHRGMALHDHPATSFQGGWNHKGTRYLDVSERYEHFHQAAAVARDHKQIAIRDAGRSADIYINHGARRSGPVTASSTDLRQGPGYIKVHP